MRTQFNRFIFSLVFLGVHVLAIAQIDNQIKVDALHKPVRQLFSLADVRVEDPHMLLLQELDVSGVELKELINILQGVLTLPYIVVYVFEGSR